jgi:hypothetical protein
MGYERFANWFGQCGLAVALTAASAKCRRPRQRAPGRRGYLIIAGRQRCHRALITARTQTHATTTASQMMKAWIMTPPRAPHFTRNEARMDAMKSLTLR